MRIRLPNLAKHVPQPLTAVDVTDVELGNDHTTAVITYSARERSVSFVSHWKDTGGPHPVVIHAELAAARVDHM